MTQSDTATRLNKHSQLCVIRNRRIALIALGWSTAMLCATIKEVRAPLPMEHFSLREHWAFIYATILLLLVFWAVKCPRERLWLGVALSYHAVTVGRLLLPGLLAPAGGIIRILSLLPWAIATPLSTSFVISAFRGASADSRQR